jgi:hypothetical protein
VGGGAGPFGETAEGHHVRNVLQAAWRWLRGVLTQAADESDDVFRYELPDLATRLTLIHNEGRTAVAPESSRAYTDDCLPLDPLSRVEGGDGIVEGRDGADIRPQPAIPDPLDDLT